MKRAVCVFLVIIGLFSIITLSGCSTDRDANNDSSDSGQTLTLNKKYIIYTDIPMIEDNYTYYIFNSDDSGEYCYAYTADLNKYLVNFKYLIIEDTVVCFFDSTNGFKSSDWNSTLGFSKDVLMSITGGITGTIYICEDYLPNIPNFGK
jgi:hypothetical protein